MRSWRTDEVFTWEICLLSGDRLEIDAPAPTEHNGVLWFGMSFVVPVASVSYVKAVWS